MSLITIEGDLLDFPNSIQVIAHSANCLNVMGAGIAKQIKDRYPEAWKADCKAANEKRNTLGNYSKAEFLSNKKSVSIYNLYTQQDIGRRYRQVDYEAFYTSCFRLRLELQQLQEANLVNIRLGFPYKISCNNAGGSWNVIETMLNDIYDRSDLEVFIVRNPLYD